jgi:hypothetical protein
MIVKEALQTAAVAAPFVIPLISRGADQIKCWYDSYGKEQAAEIKEIQNIYSSFCWPLEKEHSTLTTLNLESSQGQEKSKDSSKLPIYLQTEDDGKIPVLFRRKFCPEKDSSYWEKLINKDSAIRHPIEEAISTICHYQVTRDQRLFTGTGYNYDPTNLFFEELKAWFVKLSQATLDDLTYKIVHARFKYLGEIYAKGVFKPGNHALTRIETIKYIRANLQKLIIPSISLALSRVSAREHFNKLKLKTENNIKVGVKLLFYIFRDTPNTPSNFIFDGIRYYDIHGYKQVVGSTISGQLLSYLVNTDLMKRVFPESGLKNTHTYKSLSLNYSNPFFNEQGDLIYPLARSNTNPNNWYLAEEKADFNQTGILIEFRKDKELMETFLRVHAELHKLCLFYLICDRLFELSGDGGNILIYGFAMNKTELVLREYKRIIQQAWDHIEILFEKAEMYKATLIQKNKIENKKIETWDKLYYSIYSAHEELKEGIDDSKLLVQAIEGKIVEVKSEKYQNDFKDRLSSFYSMADLFAGKDERLTEATGLTKSGMLENPSGSSNFLHNQDDDIARLHQLIQNNRNVEGRIENLNITEGDMGLTINADLQEFQLKK